MIASPSPRYRLVPMPEGGIRFVQGMPHNGVPCQCCGCEIKAGDAYCWLCAIFGGRRKVR